MCLKQLSKFGGLKGLMVALRFWVTGFPPIRRRHLLNLCNPHSFRISSWSIVQIHELWKLTLCSVSLCSSISSPLPSPPPHPTPNLILLWTLRFLNRFFGHAHFEALQNYSAMRAIPTLRALKLESYSYCKCVFSRQGATQGSPRLKPGSDPQFCHCDDQSCSPSIPVGLHLRSLQVNSVLISHSLMDDSSSIKLSVSSLQPLFHSSSLEGESREYCGILEEWLPLQCYMYSKHSTTEKFSFHPAIFL